MGLALLSEPSLAIAIAAAAKKEAMSVARTKAEELSSMMELMTVLWGREWLHGFREGLGRRERHSGRRGIRIASDTTGVATQLVTEIHPVGRDRRSISPGRKRLELEQIGDGDSRGPAIRL